ncbi:MAG: hypothetical protein ACRCYO_17120 [Bacteroidia bacterium]
MFENPLFETINALVLIYAFLSIFVSILTEWLNQLNKHRGAMLQKAVEHMFNKVMQTDLAQKIYAHPLIGYAGDKKTLPDYIAASTFADVAIDIIGKLPQNNADNTTTPVDTTTDPLARFKTSIDAMPDGELKKLLVFFYERSKNEQSGLFELSLLRSHLISWYNDHMAKLTGSFKVETRRRTLIFGFIIAIGLNVDSINLVRTFMQDNNLRKEVVGDADVVASIWQNTNDSIFSSKISTLLDSVSVYKKIKDTSNNASRLNYAIKGLGKLKTISDTLGKKQMAEGSVALGLLDSYNIPMGWDNDAAPLSWLPCNVDTRIKNRGALVSVKGAYIEVHNNYPNFISWVLYLLGIVITAFSLSYGAPFWFDMLVKLINIRRSGMRPPPEGK